MSMFRQLVSTVIVVFLVLHAAMGWSQPDATRPLFELYSWPGQLGDPMARESWAFSILVDTSSMKQASEIFAPRVVVHGLDALGKRLDLLPPNSDVLWIEAIHEVKRQGNDFVRGDVVKGTERLALPPAELMDRVRQMVRSRGLRFVGVTGGDHTSVEE